MFWGCYGVPGKRCDLGWSFHLENKRALLTKLRVAPWWVMELRMEAATEGIQVAIATANSLYERVEMDIIGRGFAQGISNVVAPDMIGRAHDTTINLAKEVVPDLEGGEEKEQE